MAESGVGGVDEGGERNKKNKREKDGNSRVLRQVVTARLSDREFIPAIPSPRRSSRFHQGPLTRQEKDRRARRRSYERGTRKHSAIDITNVTAAPPTLLFAPRERHECRPTRPQLGRDKSTLSRNYDRIGRLVATVRARANHAELISPVRATIWTGRTIARCVAYTYALVSMIIARRPDHSSAFSFHVSSVDPWTTDVSYSVLFCTTRASEIGCEVRCNVVIS